MNIKLYDLYKSQGFIKYFKNTSILLVEKILRLCIGVFVGIWLARYLGPDQFGILNYCQSFVGLFMPLAMLGLNAVVVKKIVSNRDKTNDILGTSFVLKLLGGILVFLLLIVSFYLTDNNAEENKLILVISLGLFFQSFNVIDFFYQSQVKSKYTVYSSLFSLIISSLLKVLFICYKLDLLYFVGLIVLDSVALSIGLIRYYCKMGYSIFDWKWDYQLSKSLLSESWPLILSGISFVIYNNIDKIMLKEMISDNAVGIYSSANRLVVVWQFLPGLLVTSFLPALVNARKINEEFFMNRLKYLGSLLIWFALGLSLIYTCFSELIIKYTFGKDYESASEILIYLVWSNVFIFFNSVWNRWMLIDKNTKITLYFAITTSILNIVLNYILILRFGVVGASMAIVFSLFISYLLFYVVLDYRVIKLFFDSLFLSYLKEKK